MHRIPIFTRPETVSIILDSLLHKSNRDYQSRQEGIYPELIQTNEMMWQKIEYVHNNPVKRGYVDMAEHWRYSSARVYAGESGLLEITKEWS